MKTSSEKLRIGIKVLALLLVGAISLFILADKLPEHSIITESLECVEENRETVMKLSAATLSASLAISAFPDDFATPLAESLTDMNIYFIGLLIILFLEKILLKSGIELAFAIMIPVACLLWAASIVLGKDLLKGLALRVLVLAIAISAVVPVSTYATKWVAAELLTYVDDTIVETADGADKINEAMEGSEDEKTIFEKLSDLFQTAVNGVSDLMLHLQNTIRRCMNSIAILIVTNFVMPLLTFLVLKWVLKETFNVVLPSIPRPVHRHGGDTPAPAPVPAEKPQTELAAVGEERE